MPLTEHAAATAFASAWNRVDTEALPELLAPIARYTSPWVFAELASRQAIADYLRSKKTVRNHRINDPWHRARAELTTLGGGPQTASP